MSNERGGLGQRIIPTSVVPCGLKLIRRLPKQEAGKEPAKVKKATASVRASIT